MISYSDFGKLRMEDFWPPGCKIEQTELVSCAIGYGNGQQFGFCYFLWPVRAPGEVSEIRLEQFGPEDCPLQVADTIFTTLGLDFSVREPRDVFADRLGQAVETSEALSGLLSSRYLIGSQDKYYIECFFRKSTS